MRILFLCVANARRSQMAEGLARAIPPACVKVESAGSDPGTLNPLAVDAMAGIGIDISGHRSKGLDAVDAGRADIIFTLCAEAVCPHVRANVERLHWPIEDPQDADGFRTARDGIRTRIQALAQERFR